MEDYGKYETLDQRNGKSGSIIRAVNFVIEKLIKIEKFVIKKTGEREIYKVCAVRENLLTG